MAGDWRGMVPLFGNAGIAWLPIAEVLKNIQPWDRKAA